MRQCLSGLRRQPEPRGAVFSGRARRRPRRLQLRRERRWKRRKLAETNDVDNPTFLSVTPDGSRIYANSEVFTWREGTVSAYSFDRGSATLTYLNKQPSLGSITAHNTITRDGTKLLVANYGMGEGGPDRAVAVYGFDKNGAPVGAAGQRLAQGHRARMRRGRNARMRTASPKPLPAARPSSPISASTGWCPTASGATAV